MIRLVELWGLWNFPNFKNIVLKSFFVYIECLYFFFREYICIDSYLFGFLSS